MAVAKIRDPEPKAIGPENEKETNTLVSRILAKEPSVVRQTLDRSLDQGLNVGDSSIRLSPQINGGIPKQELNLKQAMELAKESSNASPDSASNFGSHRVVISDAVKFLRTSQDKLAAERKALERELSAVDAELKKLEAVIATLIK